MYDAMFCGRCPAIHQTTKLCCPACGFIMVGVVVGEDGEVLRCRVAVKPLPTRLPMPELRAR